MPHRSAPTPLSRAGHAMGACATAALCLVVQPATAAAAPSPATDAQLRAGNAFLSNGPVELGSRPNGTYGSAVAAPAGYHPNVGRLLGLRVDRGGDGWGVGRDDGDFIMPGTPYEGWAVQVGGGAAHWNTHAATAVAGANGSPTATAAAASVTWTSSDPAGVDGLAVRQVTTVAAGSMATTTEITLTNTTASAMADVSYLRAIDADSCVTEAAPVCDSDGDGRGDAPHRGATRNAVLGQVDAGDPTSAVAAGQTDGSYLELRTDAPGSVGAIGTGGFCMTPADLARFVTAPPAGCPVSTARGSHALTDSLIYLLVRTPALAPGRARTFRFSYVLTAAAARSPQTVTFPAPPDTALAAGPVTLHATVDSGLAATYTSQSTDVCTVHGATVTLIAAGTCTIAADQRGDATHLAAPRVTRSFTVLRDPQAIAFPAPGDTLRPAGTLRLAATADSGLAVAYTSQSTDVCTVHGADVALIAAGTCTIAADQAGDATHLAASRVTRSFAVLDAPADLTSSGSGARSQRVTGAVPDGGSVTLLDAGGRPADTVTVAGQGSYTVSGATIVFTPVAGFAGTATPVVFRVADAADNTGTARYTPTVLRPGGQPSVTATQIVLVAGGGAVAVGAAMVLTLLALRRRGLVG